MLEDEARGALTRVNLDETAMETERTRVMPVPAASAMVLKLQLLPKLEAWFEAGVSVLPKSKKARALIVLIALSAGKTVSRAKAASMLWSNLERTAGLARLRNTLHYLQQELGHADSRLFLIDDQTIAFKPDALWVDIEQGLFEDAVRAGLDREFLVELEGIDPAYDGWLTRIRDEPSIRQRTARSIEASTDTPKARQRPVVGPTVAVIEIESVGLAVEEQVTRALSEETGNALAKTRWFQTITRNSRGHRLSATSDEVCNADYMLVGTLQFDDGRYRLLLKLLDLADSARIVWTESFEEPAAPTFVLQRKFANITASRLDKELLIIEAERHRRLPQQKTDAYSSVLLAIPGIYRLDRDQFLGAGHFLEEAVANDRESALAHSWLAYWHLFLIGQGWAANPSQTMAKAGKAAERAMMLDPKDARALTIAGHVRAYLGLGRQLEQASALHELAIQTNPALSLAWHLYSVTHAYSGRLEDAYRCILHCLELSPSDPHGFFAEGALGIIEFLRGQHEAAAAIGRKVTQRHPNFSSAYKSYLAALGHLGLKAEATNVLNRLHALEPNFSIQRFRALAHYRRPEDVDRFVTGFRLAGLS